MTITNNMSTVTPTIEIHQHYQSGSPCAHFAMHIFRCCLKYSSANKIFAVLRRNRSDPLSRTMGCILELRAGSRSAGYERFGTGNLAPLAVLVPIPKPATHSKGVMNWNDVLVTWYLYINKQLYTYVYFRDINNHLLHYTSILTGEIKTKTLHLYLLIIYCVL